MQRTDYDAIIVGARVAGATTAMLLARAGHKVLLTDRARFPSDIAAGHFVHRHGPQRLERWGLLDRIKRSGAQPITQMTSYFGDFLLTADDIQTNGIPWGIGPRRKVLDQILVDAAIDAGAEFLPNTAIHTPIEEDDRVVGVQTSGGQRIRARLTIGADGRQSRIASAVHAPAYEEVPTLACWYFSYFAEVPNQRMEMHVLPERRAVFTFPTNDNLFAVFVGFPISEFQEVKANPEAQFLAALDLAPGLGERVRAGRRAERIYGTGQMPNFLRKPFGPGWALVGDAGCHKDPFLALGVCDALRDAELLAAAAHRGLSDLEPLNVALEHYERERNAACLDDYRENVQRARLLPVPPEVLRLRAALRTSPEDATRWVLASHHMIPRERFFNPTNLARLMATAEVAA